MSFKKSELDYANHPIHKSDESSDHEEHYLNPQDVKDNAEDCEEDDIIEEIIDDDDDEDNYESLLEEVDNDVDQYDSNHDHYMPLSPLFERDYRCFSLSFIKQGDLDVGNKIILPTNDLTPIIQKQVPMPLQFEIHNLSKGKVSHCGVYQFSGHEKGVGFMPDWMMENMQLKEGDFMYMKNTTLEKGTYIKLQLHTSDFMEISDPKAVLEENLRKFSCITKGDTIVIVNGSKTYHIDLVETKPDNAISVIDIDIEVDFTTPLDYKEPVNHTAPTKKLSVTAARSPLKKGHEEEPTEKPKFKPFTGVGRKLGEESRSDIGSSPKPGLAGNLGEEPSEDLGYLPLLAAAAQRRTEAAEAKAISNSTSQPHNIRKELNGEKPKFQPFTGKKYTLGS